MLLTATRIESEYNMYDLAQAIQKDRRQKSDHNRVVSNLPKERSVSVGRYRVTVSKRSGAALPAA